MTANEISNNIQRLLAAQDLSVIDGVVKNTLSITGADRDALKAKLYALKDSADITDKYSFVYQLLNMTEPVVSGTGELYTNTYTGEDRSALKTKLVNILTA